MSKSDTIDLSQEEIERLVDEGYSARKPAGIFKKIYLAIGLFMGIFHIYFLGYSSLDPWIMYMSHLCFGIVLAYLLYPFSVKSNRILPTGFDLLFALAAVASCFYYIVTMEEVIYRIGVSPTTWDLVAAVAIIILVLEMTRRTNGPVLPIIAVLFILYALFGNLLPHELGGHRGYSFTRLASYIVGLEGMLSTPLAASANYVFLLLMFSAFLAGTGAGKFFIDLAMALAGGRRGGPAKVAIIGSALFGTISGNSCANVVASGTFTIPMMRSVGYSASFSGAVEAVASTGGQITPPILGAAAFIIAELIGRPYLDIAIAAIIPALLYFGSIFYNVDLEAAKSGLKGLPKEQLGNPWRITLAYGHLVLPIFVLMFTLIVLNTSVARASIWAIYSTFICVYLRRSTWIPWQKLVEGFADAAKQAVGLIAACATAGIVIGVLNMTGSGLKLAGGIIALAQGHLPVALVLTMIAALILGMGLPTAASYLICASVIAPALVKMGVEPLYAHMFIFYFACLSAISPPVALAAFTAATLSKSNPVTVALTACRLGFVAFIVPFMFVYEPSLLCEGSLGDILVTLVTAMAGVCALGSSLQGFFAEHPLPILSRLLFFAAAITLIIPGLLTDAIGAALFFIGLLLQRYQVRKSLRTETA